MKRVETQSRHTPGPWTCNLRGEVYEPSGEIVGQCYDNPGEDESHFNTLLFAAAPDLLAACKAARFNTGDPTIYEMLGRAIEKAEKSELYPNGLLA